MEHRKHKCGWKNRHFKISRHQELRAPQYSVGDAWEVGMGVVVAVSAEHVLAAAMLGKS